MTHRRLLPRRRRTDRQQEAADIAGIGEPHDLTNGDGVNQDGENEQPWTPSGLLDLGQNDQDGQVTLVSCHYVWQNLLNYRTHMHLSLSNDL